MEYENSSNIIYCVENGLLKITLNRPEKKNAITNSMYKNLLEIFHKFIQDNTIHTVCLTGNGHFFSSGNDFVSLFTNEDISDIKSIVNNFKKFIDMLITYPKLLIAVVNGPAIGIAVTILPLFDIIYASDTAYFQTPFTRLGLIAEGCSTYTFPKIFGKSKAGDMLYLGYKMNAFEAKQYGLVSEIYKYECLNEVWIYLKKLTKLSSESILAIKHLVKKWNQNILLEVNAEECIELIKHVQSSDSIERLTNFILHKNKI
ncbi:enoyl-CoA delta isomerase 3, peroxisomal [Apis mellifera]|uniref:Enoyl-CoA delta isomerase 3, peroxisomal n=1 Tax=Apis mellifera TaxID=7460 RepID=A0A7M7RAM3_APIME|nr:enoyl-CoA delta isomerase 3, peroxisomal [Apis mellifera]|eukprot:XP_624525.3 enoyl-CoA delta isomerase 3, peroxisomal [Apis mellifera]